MTIWVQKYTVYIRDSLGCIDSQQFELLVPIDLTIDLEAEVEIVLGQKATLQPILNFSRDEFSGILRKAWAVAIVWNLK